MKVPTYLAEADHDATRKSWPNELPQRVPIVTDDGILWPLAVGTSLSIVAQPSSPLARMARLISEGKAVSAVLVQDCMRVLSRARTNTRAQIQDTLDQHGDRVTLDRRQRRLNLIDKLIRAFEYGLGLWDVHEPIMTIDQRVTFLDDG